MDIRAAEISAILKDQIKILFVVIVAIIIGLMDVILQGILVTWLPAWLR